MSYFYKVLESNLHLLKPIWPEIIVDTISGPDIVNTDGLASEAKFKIEFYQQRQYITSVFIKADGAWFSTVENIAVKKAMRAWIEPLLT